MSGRAVNLSQENFRIAFTVEQYTWNPKQLNDLRYIKYIFRLYGKRKGEYYQRILPYHTCTDDDYDKFYPVKKSSVSFLKKIRENPERGMFCLDWNDDDPIELIGDTHDDDYTRLELLVVPCNYVHTMLDYQYDSVNPQCVEDL